MSSLLEKCDICADDNPIRTTELRMTTDSNMFICAKCHDDFCTWFLSQFGDKEIQLSQRGVEYNGWQ